MFSQQNPDTKEMSCFVGETHRNDMSNIITNSSELFLYSADYLT